MPETTLERRLAAIVGADRVLDDPEVCASYGRDVTGRFGGAARLVVRPGDTREVAEVLAVCHGAGVPVVPQGGNTGLVGAGVPRGGEVVLSLTRLDALGPVDPIAAQVTAGAGVTLEHLQQHAAEAGLAFGVDHGARSGATVGGMVATNAGGAQVLRHGTMRAQVMGVEAVLADGRIVRRLAGLLKDNAGYDLTQLLVGSEGTLAVVTAARLRLVPKPAHVVTALLGVGSTGDAIEVMWALRDRVPSLNALEIFYADGLELVCAHRRLSAPFADTHPVYVVAECAAPADPLQELADGLEGTPVLDVAVADDTARRRALWTYREAHNEAIAAAGIPHKLDATVQLRDSPAFEQQVRTVVGAAAPGARTIIYGHLGDGNLHVNVIGPEPDDESVDEAVLELVGEFGGSISAEHGVGVAKRRWLHLTRSSEEIALMAAVKEAFDPQRILNPGVLLPDRGSERALVSIGALPQAASAEEG
jgi:FAD/FMN-containing dehydrogenase